MSRVFVLGLCALSLLAIGCTSSTQSTTASKIFFASDRDGQTAVFVMDANGANVERLTDPAFESGLPSLSRDGTKVVFETKRDGNPEIYVMDADGTNQTRITNLAAVDTQPSFSYDGTMIAFVSDRTGNSEVHVMNADGSNVQQVTTGGFSPLTPKFHPAGDKIAFSSQRGLSPEVFMIDIDGSNETQVSQVEDTWNFSPTFMHDGQSLLMIEYTPISGASRVVRLNLATSTETPLWFGSADISSISLSPDGTQLAYTVIIGSSSEIYSSTLEGLAFINLTNNAAIDSGPSFGP